MSYKKYETGTLFQGLVPLKLFKLGHNLSSSTNRPTANKVRWVARHSLQISAVLFPFDPFRLSPFQIVLNKKRPEFLTARADSSF